MKQKIGWRAIGPLFALTTAGLWLASACSPVESGTPPSSIITAGPTAMVTEQLFGAPEDSSPTAVTVPVVVAGRSTAAETLKPYLYTTPLPSPTPTILDGSYSREVAYEGMPVPYRRCAPYRVEGGLWALNLKAAVFRVSHEATGFHGVGSFTVSEDRLVLFNDPNCHLDVGTYTWILAGGLLTLTVVEDECAFGLRAKNLTTGPWVITNEQGRGIDRCQPQSVGAASTGHWPAPAGCLSAYPNAPPLLI